MSIPSIRTCLAALAAGLASIAIACSGPSSSLNNNSDTNSDDVTAAKKTKKTNANNPNLDGTDDFGNGPTGQRPGPTVVDAGTDAASGSESQCMATCIGTDTSAQQIWTTFSTCDTKCGPTDTNCSNNCFQAIVPQCQQHAASCDLLGTCSDRCAPNQTGTTGVPTYAQVAPIISQTCGQCHTNDFSTLQQVKANRSIMFQALSGGFMPPGQSNFSQTQNGQTLLSFLQSSPELN